MALANTKGQFHVALDGVGLLLEGAPDRLSYQQDQAPIYGQRFASGDRDYDDLSFFWYLTQTDWSGGFKSSFSWADDAKYYYSSNIDVRTRPGTIRLERQVADVRDNEAGGNDEVLDVKNIFYGPGSSETVSLENDGLDILSGGSNLFSSGIGTPHFVHSHRGYVWVLGTVITADNTVGGAATAKTSQVDSVIGGSVQEATAAVSVGDVLYIFGISTTDNVFCVKTSVASPAAGGDWSLVFEIPVRANFGASVVGAAQLGGQIVFMIEGEPQWSLYSLDIASGATLLLREFDRCDQLGIYSKGSRYVQSFGLDKVLITVINDSDGGKGAIWVYDGSTLTEIYNTDDIKYSVAASSIEPIGFLRGGCTIFGNEAYWGNLVYTGDTIHNFIKDVTDSVTNVSIPIGSDGILLYTVDLTVDGDDDQTFIRSYNPVGTTYKDGADHGAFIVFSLHDKLQSIDKLLNQVTIGFDELASGQSIAIYYTTDTFPAPDISGWTLLGSASYSVDGGSLTAKMLPFSEGTTVKKVWFRVELVGGGSNTPTMTDFTLEYLPLPDQRKQWRLNVNSGTAVRRLNGALVNMTGRELKSRLEIAWLTKSFLDFQDIDYATTQLNGAIDDNDTTITVDARGTADFPEQGRIHIDDEEIFYTGKTDKSFTGCIRGARGTQAVAHSDNAVVNNAYRVLVTDFSSKIPISLDDKHLEYVVGLTLREA